MMFCQFAFLSAISLLGRTTDAITSSPPSTISQSSILSTTPLLLPPLSTITNISTPFNASNPAIQCFTNPDPAKSPPILRRIVVDDYFEVLQKIMLEDDAMTPLQWDIPPRGSVQWIYEQVIIAMGSPRPRSLQVFQPILIARAAAFIADKCLREQTGYLGGQTFLGSGGEFRVALASPLVVKASDL